MQLFIWEDLENLTDRYHPEGGCVVIADNIERALELLPKDCDAKRKNPSVFNVQTTEEKVFIFPDAGCC